MTKVAKNKILFDGDCSICNKWVRWVKKREHASRAFEFIPLLSNEGKALKNVFQISNNVDSIIFVNENNSYIYSEAIIEICKQLRKPYNWLSAIRIIPAFIRNPIYRWVAKKRLFFNHNNHCKIKLGK